MKASDSGGERYALLNRWERWDPFAELNTLQRQMDRLFRDSFQDTFQFSGSNTNGGTFLLHITIENGVLTVRGERKLEEGEKEENFL